MTMHDLHVIAGPRIGRRPVWDRREHRTIWIPCAPTPLRSEYEAPRPVAGTGGRRHRKRREAANRAYHRAWVNRLPARDRYDDLPF